MPSPRTVLLVTCHPDPRSLNGTLRDHAIDVLMRQGHRVEQSDLYAMKWKAVVDADDFPAEAHGARLAVGMASRRATEGGTLTADVVAEQAKLARADAVIFQFPLWWFGVPAMLKGWFDRVLSNGFAYGLMLPSGRTRRYGEGNLAGKRALLSVTTGGMTSHFSERGINGRLEDLLFPVTHGCLFYPGMDVLPLFSAHGCNRVTDEQFPVIRDAYTKRLDSLFTDAPIAFRGQNGGDYEDDLTLKAGLSKGAAGFALHRH